MKRGHREGFTLVELLVVVAMIAALAMILLPVFAQARAKARQATCASNLAQIARAGLMYLQDYDERFPSCYWIREPPYVMDPCTLLQPYLKNWGVFYCPERHTVRHDCLDPATGFQPDARCMGYGYNWGSGPGTNTTALKGDGLVRPGPAMVYGVALVEVATPAHCLFYGDTNDSLFITLLRQAMPGVLKEGKADATTDDLGLPYEPPRHSGGNNFAFVDGHVQWLRFPGNLWIDGGPWVVPDMGMYSRTGRWETAPVP
jgi:prepilin-type processing-associated H-X9-DG protein/prepilin-type N-terminal cleavage/methylation domain-containing protein